MCRLRPTFTVQIQNSALARSAEINVTTMHADDLKFMSLALECAADAEARGEVPVGAVLVAVHCPVEGVVDVHYHVLFGRVISVKDGILIEFSALTALPILLLFVERNLPAEKHV